MVHPKEVIIFVMGGVTYAEAAAVDQWNEMQQEKGEQKRVTIYSLFTQYWLTIRV